MTNFMSNLGIGKGSDTSTQSLRAVGFLNYYDPDFIASAAPKFTILTEAAWTSDNIGAALKIALESLFYFEAKGAVLANVNWNYSVGSGKVNCLAQKDTITFVFRVGDHLRHQKNDTQDTSSTIAGASDMLKFARICT